MQSSDPEDYDDKEKDHYRDDIKDIKEQMKIFENYLKNIQNMPMLYYWDQQELEKVH